MSIRKQLAYDLTGEAAYPWLGQKKETLVAVTTRYALWLAETLRACTSPEVLAAQHVCGEHCSHIHQWPR